MAYGKEDMLFIKISTIQINMKQGHCEVTPRDSQHKTEFKHGAPTTLWAIHFIP